MTNTHILDIRESRADALDAPLVWPHIALACLGAWTLAAVGAWALAVVVWGA